MMKLSGLRIVAGGLSLVAMATAFGAASAQQQQQPYPPSGYGQQPPPGYGQQPPPGYDNPPPAYDRGASQYYANGAPPPPPPPPPPGYDGSQPPPPPPGYQQGADYAQWQARDRQYSSYAQQWAQAYCVKSQGNPAAGAIIGGIAGAILGSAIGGRGGHTAGAVIGGSAGVVGGAAIGASSGNATSPGCPPGYVVRRGAPAFVYNDGPDPYVYAAPEWYRPWIFYDGLWVYRPYPYHVYYYSHYYRGGYYGGYRGHYGDRRGRRW